MAKGASWTRAALEREGFRGWLTFTALIESIDSIPASGGVYVVVRPSSTPPLFRDANPAGRFKGRDPTVPQEALWSNWVGGVEVVYVGKADDLRRRLREYARFGEGDPVGHWGGRLIWQLADSGELQVGWRETPGRVPRTVEVELIEAFRKDFGQPPFANDPHRLGR